MNERKKLSPVFGEESSSSLGTIGAAWTTTSVSPNTTGKCFRDYPGGTYLSPPEKSEEPEAFESFETWLCLFVTG
jgi:hypothetical protein